MMIEDGSSLILMRKNSCLKISFPTFKQLLLVNMLEHLLLGLEIGKELLI